MLRSIFFLPDPFFFSPPFVYFFYLWFPRNLSIELLVAVMISYDCLGSACKTRPEEYFNSCFMHGSAGDQAFPARLVTETNVIQGPAHGGRRQASLSPDPNNRLYVCWHRYWRNPFFSAYMRGIQEVNGSVCLCVFYGRVILFIGEEVKWCEFVR